MLENKQPKKTELNTLGEFGLIDHLTEKIKVKNKSTIKGIGDDAAVISSKKEIVISTDMLVEGIHFDLAYSPLKHLGYKAVVVNISDIYAMNAQAKQITVSMAVSSKYTVEALEEIYSGILLACKNYGLDLIGGDTTSSLSGLVLSITAIGEGEKNKLVYRNNAKENDLLVVSGDLGGAFMGLQLLEREKSVFMENPNMQPDLDGYDYILERQLKPEARKDAIQYLEELGILPGSMIDISDGLASEIKHLCKQSKVGCSIYEEKIPIDPTTFNSARDFNLDPITCALNGGEDYELLFTIKQADYDKLKGSPHFTVIGHITDKNSGINLISNSGSVVPIKAQGWDAFEKN